MIVDFFNSLPNWLKTFICILVCVWSLGSAFKNIFIQKAFYDAALKIIIFLIAVIILLNTILSLGIKLY